MSDKNQITKPADMQGKTIAFAAYIGAFDIDLAIRFTDDTFAVLSGQGNGCYGEVIMDSEARAIHRHDLGLMDSAEAMQLEDAMIRKKREERLRDEREFEKLRVKLGR